MTEDEYQAVDKTDCDEYELDVDILLFELHHVVDKACVNEEERPDIQPERCRERSQHIELYAFFPSHLL